MKRKLSLRTHLAFWMTFLVIGSVGFVAFVLSYASRLAVDQLVGQVIQDNLSLVEQRVDDLLGATSRAGKSVQSVIRPNGALQAEDVAFAKLEPMLGGLRSILTIEEDVAYVSLTTEATGEFVQASKVGKKVILQLNERVAEGRYHRRDWELMPDGSQKLVLDNPNLAVDSRTRPYYVKAKQAAEQTWTEVYEFIPAAGAKPEKGITCATPIYDAKGALLGVSTADLTLSGLSKFLSRFRPADEGVTVIMDVNGEGIRPVVSPLEDGSLSDNAELLAPIFNQMKGQNATQGAVHVASGLDGRPALAGSTQVRAAEPNWSILAVVPEAYYQRQLRTAQQVVGLASIALVLGALALSWVIASNLSKSMRLLAEEAARIQKLNLEDPPQLNAVVREVDELDRAVDNMRVGLRSFQRLVPSAYVRHLIETGQEAALGGEQRTMTVMFCDIEGFTGYAERHSIDDTMAQLNTFLEACSNEVLHMGGTIDKYLGDEVMAFWGAPTLINDHVTRACRTALRIQARLRYLRQKQMRQGATELDAIRARVGIASGPMIVGNVGTRERMNYTVIGDRVNLASRLQSLNKVFGTEMLIDQAVALALNTEFLVRKVDRVAVYGKNEVITVSELMGIKEVASPEDLRVAKSTNEAFNAYVARDFVNAVRLYAEVLDVRPDCQVAQTLMARAQHFQSAPPPPDWQGETVLAAK